MPDPEPTTPFDGNFDRILLVVAAVAFVVMAVTIPGPADGESDLHYIMEGRDSVVSLAANVVCAAAMVFWLMRALARIGVEKPFDPSIPRFTAQGSSHPESRP